MQPVYAITIVALLSVLGLISLARGRGIPISTLARVGIPTLMALAAVGALLASPRLGLIATAVLFLLFLLRRSSGPAATNPTNDDSSVRTASLDATLDHATGRMDADVRRGQFEGKRLSDLNQRELRALYEELLSSDPDGARIVEVFTEREHPDWHANSDNDGHADGDAQSATEMDDARALSILGLAADSTPQEIVDAHRRLINRMHPDRGGSSYLAAEINRAKDHLMASRK